MTQSLTTLNNLYKHIRFGPHSFKKHLCKSSIYEGVFLFTYRFTYRFEADAIKVPLFLRALYLYIINI